MNWPEADGEAHRRLLDMLAGWRDYVLKCSEAEDLPAPDPSPEAYLSEFDRIADLYQDAGARSCPTEDTLRKLVAEAVSLLLTGQRPERT